MAAIPVPVHFDGHNINIITEDSPSTCKNRVKGINFGPGQKQKQKKRRNGNGNGKTQILNKRAPGDSGSVATSPSEGDANSVNLSPSNNKENIEQNDINNNALSPSTDENAQCPSVPAIIDPSKDETKTSNDGLESSESMTATSLKPIELNAANLAKNPFTKRSNNESNTNNNNNNNNLTPNTSNKLPSLSPAPITSTGNSIEGTKKQRGSSPGLPIPPRQEFQPRNVGNGALNKRNSPRLPVPFNPNNVQNQQQAMFEGQQQFDAQNPLHSLDTLDNPEQATLNGQQLQGIPDTLNALNPPNAFTGLPQGIPQAALQQAVIDGGIGGIQNPQILQQQIAGLNPEEFGSHDDIGFEEDDDQTQGKDRQNLYKTELCREWSTSGWCYYNKRCSFAHGLQELRPVFRSKKWRTKRCRNWHTTGYCPYEHRCQFLHDQSPPRRISDYATANARALVAAQQRMQPLYFHYQVDCDRNETSDDQGDDDNTKTKGASSITDTNRQSTVNEINPNTPSIGPRLKRKGYNIHNQLNKQNHLSPNQNGNANLNPAQIPPTPTEAISNSPNMNSLLPESHQKVQNHLQQNHMDASNRDIPLPFKGSKVRMMPIGKKGNKLPINKPPSVNIPAPTNANEEEMHHIPPRYQKQSQPKTPTSDISASPDQSDALKANPTKSSNILTKAERKKKKAKKDAVITPFNPVQHYQPQHQTQYEQLAAAQQLGIYDPRTAQLLPQVPVQAGAGATLHPHLSAGVMPQVAGYPPHGHVPQLNTVIPGMGHVSLAPTNNIHSAFPGLPPSIDPTLYLSLTPSPPASPATGPKPTTTIPPLTHQTAAQQLQQQQQQQLMARSLAIHQAGQVPGPDGIGVHQPIGAGNIRQAPEITPITPSPPLPLTMDPIAQHQHAQLALAKQQETLALLQSKVHQVHTAQEQQNAAAQMLLSRQLNNKSATPVPPIGGDLLQSLLPTDDTVTDTHNKIKPGLPLPPLPVPSTITTSKDHMLQDENKEMADDEPEEELSGFRSKSKDNPKTSSSSVPNTTKKPSESAKNLPPIPPIPPPLQLQTSINSVVTGAVAAAVTPTAAGFVPMTPTLVDSGAAGMFGFPTSATTTTKQTTTTQTVVTPTATSAVPTIVGAGTGVIPTTLIPSIPQQTVAYTHPHTTPGLVPVDVTYAQQAHAHAHAYAAAQAQAASIHGVHGVHTVPTAYAHTATTQAQHVAYGHTAVPTTYAAHTTHTGVHAATQYGHLGIQQIPIQPQMGYAAQTFYAPSPEFQEIPQQTYNTTGYAQYQQPPRHHYQ